MTKGITQRWLTATFAVIAAALMIALVTAPSADATHEPAMKTAAAGSDVDAIRADGESVILKDTIRVSSSQDAIISVTSECSILTSLITGDDETTNSAGMAQDTATSFGQVELRVELDGKRVPVAANDLTATPDDQGDNPTAGEVGEVVFCNRAYQRTVQDRNSGSTNDEGGTEQDIDIQRDYIRTRTANAFNWLAQDIGFNYDSADNGNNIVDVVVYAEYETNPGADDPNTPAIERCPTAAGQEVTCAEAYVGSRTLIVEPTNVAIHEAVGEADGAGN